MPVNENTLEQAIISELQEMGYDYIYAPDIDRDYHEVILEDCFKESMMNINPDITMEMVAEAYRVVRDQSLLKLEDVNAAFHKLMIEGVAVAYKKDGKIVLRL